MTRQTKSAARCVRCGVKTPARRLVMTPAGPLCGKCQAADDLADAFGDAMVALQEGGLPAMRNAARLINDPVWVDACEAVAEAAAEAVRRDQYLVDGRMFTLEELRAYQRERYLAIWASHHWGPQWEEDPGREEVDILFDYWLDMGRIHAAETASG